MIPDPPATPDVPPLPPAAPWPPSTVAGISAAVAAVWFFILSGWLGFEPGLPPVLKDDLLFDSDCATWTEWLAGDDARAKPSAFHPFLNVVWRPAGRALFAAYDLALPYDDARVLAARTLLALAAAAGVGALAAIGALAGLGRSRLALLLGSFLLFSSNMVAVTPEHWGLSQGLLSITALVIWSGLHRKVKAAWLAGLTLLITGTTLTVGLYPGGAFLAHVRPAWAGGRRGIIIAGTAAVFFVIAVLLVLTNDKFHARMPNLSAHVTKYVHLRLVKEPVRAGIDSVFGLVFPAVAPFPERGANGHQTYLDYRQTTWHGLHILGALAWSILLAAGTWAAFRSSDARLFSIGLLAWIAFNLGLHSIWGDEVFLYTPHWSWSLMLLVMLGARRLPVALVAACVIAMAPAQLMTFAEVARVARGA